MNSMTELLNAAAAALAARDGDWIQRLAAIAADWLHPESEFDSAEGELA